MTDAVRISSKCDPKLPSENITILMNVFIICTFIIQAVCGYDERVITTLKHSQYLANVVPNIVNGKPATNGQIPFLVSLKVCGRHICGGTIIDKKRVLTAAHCFEQDNFLFVRDSSSLRCVAGNIQNTLPHTGKTETTLDSQWRGLKKIIVHKHFHFPANDIALVHIDEPWKFNDKVAAVSLSRRAVDRAGYCESAGYGAVGPDIKDPDSTVLLVARITILTRQLCSSLWEINMNSYVCSDTAVTDVARGDSGGPLVCNGTYNSAHWSKKILVGVVSGKNYDKTSLYTRVSAFKSWIDNNYGNTLRDKGIPMF
ncbi:chymotrypsin-1-like [Anticarsia gemmatalis]|uniref:chymotrypsin-1-like n=1 Tax=Anticarsia gemmatalis TaxID=129554 RepID=UPI003F75CDC3